MTRLQELVIDQVLAEGPQITDEVKRDRYIEDTINLWSNVELLERISDALRKMP